MDELKELFASISSDILTEETQLKIATIFEAVVNEAVKVKEDELEAQNKEELAQFKESLVEQIDSYLDYFTNEYIKENETVVEDYSKVKLAEKVLRNFNQMVEAFNVSLSDESISSEDEIEELTAENTKLVNKLIEATQEVEMVKKAAFISEASQKLETDIQKEKLVEMAKDLEFNEDLFESKLNVLIETIIAVKPAENPAKKLDEEIVDNDDKKPVVSEKMEQYLKQFKK